MRSQKTTLRSSAPSLFAFLLLFIAVASAKAQTTSFSYQGRLTDGANPANGSYQMQFALFDALTGGNQIGATLAFDGVALIRRW